MNTTPGTAVTTQAPGGALAAANAAYNPYVQEAVEAGAKFGNFLRFDGNDGTYLYGPKDDMKELSHGTQLALRMSDYRRGWYCWKDGEVVDKVLVGIEQGRPPENIADLPDHSPYKEYPDGTSDGWVKAGEVQLIDVDENGEAFSFSFFNTTKYSAFARFCGDYGKVFQFHPNEVPVIEISARSFEPKNQKKGTPPKWAPIYKIVGWLPVAEFEQMEAAALAASSESGETADAAPDAANDPANYAPVATVTATVATPVVQTVVQQPVTPTPVATPPVAAAGEPVRRSRRFTAGASA